jgi:hypothetical protein
MADKKEELIRCQSFDELTIVIQVAAISGRSLTPLCGIDELHSSSKVTKEWSIEEQANPRFNDFVYYRI